MNAVSQALAKLFPAFMERHPGVEVEVSVEDRFVDTIAEGYDAGIRIVETIHRDMVHVQLTGESQLVVVLDRGSAVERPSHAARSSNAQQHRRS